MPRSHTVSDETLNALRIRATDRLRTLDLPLSLLDDESGQTSALDHWTWLAEAPETEILDWARLDLGLPGDADILRAAIERSGLSARRFAEDVLLRDERTVRRWLSGDDIPEVVMRYLRTYLARP